MAQLSIQKGNGGEAAETKGITRPEVASDWLNPLRVMRDLLRWDPFAQVSPVQARERELLSPDFDVRETKDAFVFKADLPGLQEKDVDVHVTQNRLTVSGTREHEKADEGDTYYAYERTFGSFTRSFTLPDGVDLDHVSAELANGVLTLSVPKKPEAQPKRIPIKS